MISGPSSGLDYKKGRQLGNDFIEHFKHRPWPCGRGGVRVRVRVFFRASSHAQGYATYIARITQ
nr:MAG TPA: hypothetical protein [Caudoviricetes sp.]